MEQKTSWFTRFMKGFIFMCMCCAGAGSAFFAQKEGMKQMNDKKGNMDYYDRLG